MGMNCARSASAEACASVSSATSLSRLTVSGAASAFLLFLLLVFFGFLPSGTRISAYCTSGGATLKASAGFS